MTIKILNSERVALIGATGSGKTVLSKLLLQNQSRLIIVDPKHTYKTEDTKVLKNWRLPVFSDSFRYVIRPKRDQDSDLADFFYKLFKKGRVTIFIDELSTLVDFFPTATAQLEDIARTGREKKVAVWVAMQRPRRVPILFLSESEVFFIFRIRAEDDRKHIEGFAGSDVVNQKIKKLDFWYIRADEDGAVKYRVDPVQNKILKGGD